MAHSQGPRIPPWKEGEDAALALRLRLDLGTSPINIWDTIRRLDIALGLKDFGRDGGDGCYLNKAGAAMIVVNMGTGNAGRQRFTAAHELGHHEMHRFEQASVAIADQDVFDTGKDPLEEAANSFAGNLLAPAQGLKRELAGKDGKDLSPEDVVALMGTFGLSYDATIYRLQNSGIVDSSHGYLLRQEGKGKVNRMLEEAGIDPPDLFPPKYNLPPDYVSRVEKLWLDRRISDVRLAEMLRLDSAETIEHRKRKGLVRSELPDYDQEAARRLIEELS